MLLFFSLFPPGDKYSQYQYNSCPTINNILTNKQRNVKSGDSKIWLGNRPQIIDGKISESASNPPYILTPLMFVLELSAWYSTITTSTPTVPLQADSLAKAGLRLFIDFLTFQINKPRAIQTRGFLLTTTERHYCSNVYLLKETKNDTT